MGGGGVMRRASQMGFDRRLVVLFRFPLFDRERTGRTVAETGSGAVAEDFPFETGFAVDDFEGTLGTGGDAVAAPVAELFVDPDYVANHFGHVLLRFVFSPGRSVTSRNGDMT